jgi:hypothetical protein
VRYTGLLGRTADSHQVCHALNVNGGRIDAESLALQQSLLLEAHFEAAANQGRVLAFVN